MYSATGSLCVRSMTMGRLLGHSRVAVRPVLLPCLAGITPVCSFSSYPGPCGLEQACFPRAFTRARDVDVDVTRPADERWSACHPD